MNDMNDDYRPVSEIEAAEKAQKEALVANLIEAIGDNPNRVGLKDTPNRVVRMWGEIFRGYNPDKEPKETCFPNDEDGVKYDQMIIDTGYFHSHCEHHMVPFFGQYWFAYIPDKTIIGLSKVADWIDYYAAKLQIQERLVKEVVDKFDALAHPVGIGLVMKGRHMCKEMRDVKKFNTFMITSDLRGVLKEDSRARAELMDLIK
jgi:GTP cyclohydrolase I